MFLNQTKFVPGSFVFQNDEVLAISYLVRTDIALAILPHCIWTDNFEKLSGQSIF